MHARLSALPHTRRCRESVTSNTTAVQVEPAVNVEGAFSKFAIDSSNVIGSSRLKSFSDWLMRSSTDNDVLNAPHCSAVPAGSLTHAARTTAASANMAMQNLSTRYLYNRTAIT